MQMRRHRRDRHFVITGHCCLEETIIILRIKFYIFIVTIAVMLYMVNINNTEISQQCSGHS